MVITTTRTALAVLGSTASTVMTVSVVLVVTGLIIGGIIMYLLSERQRNTRPC